MDDQVTARSRPPLATDAVLAAIVTTVSLGGHSHATDPAGAFTTLGYVLLAIAGVVLVARRRLPRVTLAVTAGAVIAILVLGIRHQGPFVILPVMVALYTATAVGKRTPAIAAATAIVAAFGLRVLLAAPTDVVVDAQGLLWATGWLVAAIVAGEVVKGRRAYLGEVEARALEAERTREEEARRRAGEERLRIAREVHDVLGHSLSLINVQAGVAAHIIDREPDQARDALETIRRASQQALHELRATVGALQQSGDAAPLAPAPSLARLDDLIRPVTAAGVEVDVSVTGDPQPLPAPVDRAAYRIVQESLTNVLRHADAVAATVRFGYGPRDLTVEVADRGVGVTDLAQLEGGSGVLGMRERATALGGELHVTPRRDGGVRVRARLPLDGAP